MKREIITAISPEEIEKIARESGAGVRLEFGEAEPFHGMPRYRVIIEGTREEVSRFMEKLMHARAGG